VDKKSLFFIRKNSRLLVDRVTRVNKKHGILPQPLASATGAAKSVLPRNPSFIHSCLFPLAAGFTGGVCMYSTYTLNTDELTADFIVSIQKAFPRRTVEISVREAVNETEYLLRSPANRARLLQAVTDVEKGENLIAFSLSE
jgi:antitoxin YefM